MNKNQAVETKLRELWQGSLEHNSPAVHVIIHLVLAHYLGGTIGDFAKWCCQYSNDLRMNATVEGGKEVLPGELPTANLPDPTQDTPAKEWIN